MGTPVQGEEVLWQGRPNMRVLARSAFHTRKIGIYFAGLAVLAIAFGNAGAAVLLGLAGLLVIAMMYVAAWLVVKNTLYIITDARVIMRIGLAVDKRINLPLKKLGAAHLSERGQGFGDIALEPAGHHVLGYLLLWPHARPWKLARPQPMLRALPDAQTIAKKLADATAKFHAIERGETAKIDLDQRHSAGKLAGAAA